MSTALVRTLIVLAALLVFGSVNYAIYAKERTIRHGEVVYLELAPVDPRSLMQGDYMALRFSIATKVRPDPASGRIWLQLDDRRVADIARSPTESSLPLRYRMRKGDVWLGTNAYFFEEGSADRFAGARYGKFRVDRHTGDAVLVALCDDELRELGQ